MKNSPCFDCLHTWECDCMWRCREISSSFTIKRGCSHPGAIDRQTLYIHKEWCKMCPQENLLNWKLTRKLTTFIHHPSFTQSAALLSFVLPQHRLLTITIQIIKKDNEISRFRINWSFFFWFNPTSYPPLSRDLDLTWIGVHCNPYMAIIQMVHYNPVKPVK